MTQQNEYLSLNWAKEDPENKVGLFRAGPYTTVNNGLAMMVAVILAGLFFALAFFALKPLAVKAAWMATVVDPVTRTQNMIVVVPIAYLFFWCVATLFIKGRKIRFQERALDLATVPQQVDFVLNETTAQDVLRRLYQLVDSPRHFILLNRVDRALANLRNVGGVSDVSSILKSQSDNDENQISSSYLRIQGFVWAIPVLGFIGTVIGLSKAIGEFANTVKSDGDINKIKDSLTDVTGGLSTAFETTLIALVAALIIQLYLNRVQASENKFLDDCNDYCHSHVISKLRVTGLQDELAAARQQMEYAAAQQQIQQAGVQQPPPPQ
jgi:biopolymer transport protein ExbB/TolQ